MSEKTVHLVILAGASGFAEDKDEARHLRQEQIMPALERGESVIIDFGAVKYATQSYVHALLSEPLHKYGELLLDRLEFRNCSTTVQNVIGLVVDYTFSGFPDPELTSALRTASEPPRQVFISHAQSDGRLAKRIAEALQARRFRVWFDDEPLGGMRMGASWSRKLDAALRESDALLVLLTPAAAHSKSIEYEVSYALGSFAYRGRVVAVTLGASASPAKSEIQWNFPAIRLVQLSDANPGADDLDAIEQALLAGEPSLAAQCA